MRYLSCFLSILLSGLLAAAPVRAELPANASADESASPGLNLRLLDAAGQPGDHNRISASSTSSMLVEVTDASGKPVPDAAVALRFPEAAPSATFVDGSRAAVGYTDQTGRAHLPEIHWDAAPGTVAARLTASSGTAHAGLLMEETIVPAAAVSPSQPPSPVNTPAAITVPPSPEVSAAPLPRSARLRMPASEAPEPGQPAEAEPSVQTVDASNVPLRHMLAPAGESPAISITNSGPRSAYSVERGSKKKWIIILAAAAGAGAAFALLHKGSSSSSSTSSTGVTVGAPTLSIGHP